MSYHRREIVGHKEKLGRDVICAKKDVLVYGTLHTTRREPKGIKHCTLNKRSADHATFTIGRGTVIRGCGGTKKETHAFYSSMNASREVSHVRCIPISDIHRANVPWSLRRSASSAHIMSSPMLFANSLRCRTACSMTACSASRVLDEEACARRAFTCTQPRVVHAVLAWYESYA